MEAPKMMACKFCQSSEIKVISSDPFGDEVVIQCIYCGEMFELDKAEIEENEYHED